MKRLITYPVVYVTTPYFWQQIGVLFGSLGLLIVVGTVASYLGASQYTAIAAWAAVATIAFVAFSFLSRRKSRRILELSQRASSAGLYEELLKHAAFENTATLKTGIDTTLRLLRDNIAKKHPDTRFSLSYLYLGVTPLGLTQESPIPLDIYKQSHERLASNELTSEERSYLRSGTSIAAKAMLGSVISFGSVRDWPDRASTDSWRKIGKYIQSLIAVPVFSHGYPVGVIQLTSPHEHAFNSRTVVNLLLAAGTIGTLFQLETMRSNLSERSANLYGLYMENLYALGSQDRGDRDFRDVRRFDSKVAWKARQDIGSQTER